MSSKEIPMSLEISWYINRLYLFLTKIGSIKVIGRVPGACKIARAATSIVMLHRSRSSFSLSI
jgi:hypothetical protein